MLKSQLHCCFASLFSALKFGNTHFRNFQVTLEIYNMLQVKVNRELTNLGADLTSTDMSEGYVTQSKPKNNSTIHGAEENNVLPLQTITSDDNEEPLAGTATTLSVFLPPPNNSASENLSPNEMLLPPLTSALLRLP